MMSALLVNLFSHMVQQTNIDSQVNTKDHFRNYSSLCNEKNEFVDIKRHNTKILNNNVLS